MFIKFESDAVGDGGSTMLTVECRSYSLTVKGQVKEVTLDDGETGYIIQQGVGAWQRAYVMNDRGETIDKIYAPQTPIPAGAPDGALTVTGAAYG